MSFVKKGYQAPADQDELALVSVAPTNTRLLEVLRTAALKMTEKTVNEFAYTIQRGAILIVCQSADAKYPQDCFLSASRFCAVLFDRNGVTGKSGSTGAT
jgi:hypothetical protein